MPLRAEHIQYFWRTDRVMDGTWSIGFERNLRFSPGCPMFANRRPDIPLTFRCRDSHLSRFKSAWMKTALLLLRIRPSQTKSKMAAIGRAKNRYILLLTGPTQSILLAPALM